MSSLLLLMADLIGGLSFVKTGSFRCHKCNSLRMNGHRIIGYDAQKLKAIKFAFISEILIK